MVSSIAPPTTPGPNAATTTSVASNPSGPATSGPATSGVAQAAAPAGSDSAVTVTLSPNAQRLQTAASNLKSLENGGTNLAGVWSQDYQKAGSIGIDQEPAADAEIAALPASDPAHIAQATAAQAFVKATIGSPFGSPISAPNPFAGASTQALTAIISDKSGLYAGYEKAAAVYEYQNQQNAWISQYGPGDSANDNPAGKAAYYGKAISVYNALPSLIQASYPPNYVQSHAQLQKFYASGKDDNDLPSFFGHSSRTQDSALTLLQGLTTPDNASASSG